MKALTDLNFDQIENFVEYEAFHQSSYFNSLVNKVLSIVDFLENGTEFVKSYLDNMSEQIIKEADAIMSENGLESKTRT